MSGVWVSLILTKTRHMCKLSDLNVGSNCHPGSLVETLGTNDLKQSQTKPRCHKALCSLRCMVGDKPLLFPRGVLPNCSQFSDLQVEGI